MQSLIEKAIIDLNVQKRCSIYEVSLKVDTVAIDAETVGLRTKRLRSLKKIP